MKNIKYGLVFGKMFQERRDASLRSQNETSERHRVEWRPISVGGKKKLMRGNDVIRGETDAQLKRFWEREFGRCMLNEWNCFFPLF